MDSPRKKLSFVATAIALALALSSCAVRSLFWKETGQVGPPLTNGEATRQVENCDALSIQVFPGGGSHCTYAFRSTNGLRISFGEIHKEIEDSLQFATPLRPLLYENRRQNSNTNKVPATHRRYRLYLVALRPSIVIGVPTTFDYMDSCNAYARDCFTVNEPEKPNVHGPHQWSAGLFYAKNPPVVAGSFAYIPSSRNESLELPADQQQVQINFDERLYKLENIDGRWHFRP